MNEYYSLTKIYKSANIMKKIGGEIMARIVKDPEERKNEIVETAMQVFCQKGYEATSISDIARELNIAQGLCYRYFKSKEELFDIALDQYAQRQVDQMLVIVGKSRGIENLVDTFPSFIDLENDGSIEQEFYHKDGNQKFHKLLTIRICEKMMPITEKILSEGMAQKEIPEGDVHVLASYCLYGQLGIIFDKLRTHSEKKDAIKMFTKEILNIS